MEKNVWEQLIDCVAEYLNHEYSFGKQLRIESIRGTTDAGGGYPKNIARCLVDYEGNPCVVVGLKEMPSDTLESYKKIHVTAVLREVHRFMEGEAPKEPCKAEIEADNFAESEYEKFETWMIKRGLEQSFVKKFVPYMSDGKGIFIDYLVSSGTSEDHLRIMLLYHNPQNGKNYKSVLDIDREDKDSESKLKLVSLEEWNGTRRPNWVSHIPAADNHKLKKSSKRNEHERYFKG